jgi:hypothetical protein
VLELAGLGEDFYLFIENDVANIIFAHLADLYQGHHEFELLTAATLLLQLLDE